MMSRRVKCTVAVLAVCVVLVGLPLIGLALLGPDWLKAKLIDMAREKLHANLKIESLTFSPFSGEAGLNGIEFARKTEGSDVGVTLDSFRMRLRVSSLLLRSVEIERIEADRPRITWVLHQPPDSERASTLGKLKSIFSARKGTSGRKVEFRVHELVLRDAAVDFTSLKEGGEPLKALATGIQYSARSVSLDSFGRLVYGADIEANIALGGSQAQLRKRGSASPSTFSLTNINLAHGDKYFDQSDALVMSGGTLDLGYTLGDDLVAKVQADFKGLELGENRAAAKQEFAFVPIAKLRDMTKARGGNVNLEFRFQGGSEASEDLRLLLDEVWTGMWTALIKSMSSGVIKDVFDKGKHKVLDYLKPEEKK